MHKKLLSFFKKYYNSHFLKSRHLIKALPHFIIFFVLVLISLNISIYYIAMQNVYLENLEKSGDSIIEQVGIAYEIVLKQIKDSAYQTILRDNELHLLVANYKDTSSQHQDIIKKLDNIVLNNEYFHSIYLYFPAYQKVYTTNNGMTFTFDYFYDQYAFNRISNENLYMLDPRMVQYKVYPVNKSLVISLVSTIPFQAKNYNGVLVINIDAQKLYYDILKKIKVMPNTDLYVYNSDLATIISKQEKDLFRKVDENKLEQKILYKGFLSNILKKDMRILSTYYSSPLKWHFVLETTVESQHNFITKLYSFIFYSIFLLIFVLPVVILAIKHYLKPLEKIMVSYNEKIWKDFLLDNIYDIGVFKEQLKDAYMNFKDGKFGVIALQTPSLTLTEEISSKYIDYIRHIIIPPFKNECDIRALAINKNVIAIITRFNENNSPDKCYNCLLEIAQLISKGGNLLSEVLTYIGVSTIKEGINQLPVLYNECLQAFKHKLSCTSNILQYALFKDQKLKYEYPYIIEKQLINNLLSGNTFEAKSFMTDFMSVLTSPKYNLEDNEIKNNIYQLQNSILRSISELQIPMNANLDIFSLKDMKDIEIALCSFVDKILEEIIQRKENEKYNIEDKVLAYIEERYTLKDFSLNKVADDLNLSRAHVSKIIKEKTGSNFTDYINSKRISLAKKLLEDDKKTIDDIAHEVGFNYSYYFIKIFKNIEGITPGQYRSNIFKH